MTQDDLVSTQDNSQLSVYSDLAKLYPEHEGYLRKYATLLIEAGKETTAKEILQNLHTLLLKQGSQEKADELVHQFPLIGRIRAINEANRKPIQTLLPDEMQNKVWLFVHQQRLKEGRHLFHQGDAGDTMYLLLKGELAIFITIDNGKTVLLNLVKPGEVVGEGCLLDPGHRNADVVANQDCVVVKLPRKKILSAMVDNPVLEAELKRTSDFRFMTFLLSGNPMLQKIPLNMRQDMAGEAELQTYTCGEIIHAAGSELGVVDMLVRGEAAYSMTIKERRNVLYTLALGELIGDTASFRKSSCPADIVAITDVTLAHIPFSCFKNVVEAYPPLKEGLMNYSVKQREKLMRKITSISN